MTEDEAKTKLCPYLVRGGLHCVGSGCMAWRWSTPVVDRSGPFSDDTLLTDLELSVKAVNACSYADLKTVGDVRAVTDEQLLRLKHIGVRAVRELRAMTHSEPATLRQGYCGLAGQP